MIPHLYDLHGSRPCSRHLKSYPPDRLHCLAVLSRRLELCVHCGFTSSLAKSHNVRERNVFAYRTRTINEIRAFDVSFHINRYVDPHFTSDSDILCLVGYRQLRSFMYFGEGRDFTLRMCRSENY